MKVRQITQDEYADRPTRRWHGKRAQPSMYDELFSRIDRGEILKVTASDKKEAVAIYKALQWQKFGQHKEWDISKRGLYIFAKLI